MKFGQIPISGLGGDVVKDCERTDGRTGGQTDDDGRWTVDSHNSSP